MESPKKPSLEDRVATLERKLRDLEQRDEKAARDANGAAMVAMAKKHAGR